MNDLGARVALQPAHELAQLFALATVFASEHRDREIAEPAGIDARPAARGPVQHTRVVEQRIENQGRVPKDRRVLLQVNVDAAKEQPVVAVRSLRRCAAAYSGDEQDVFASRQ